MIASLILLISYQEGVMDKCTTSNGVSSDPTDSVELRGDLYNYVIHNYYTLYSNLLLCCVAILPKPTSSAVANPPTITLQQLSATSVRVMWSQPPGGATVMGYIVHYSDMMRTVSSSSTSYDITGLTSGPTYTISVEATSQHLSGESEEMNITLREFGYSL